MNIIVNFWNWSIEPIPIMLALGIFFITTLLRRYKRIIYTPLYFLIFPLSQLNLDISRYLGEPYFYDLIEDENDAEKARKNAILITILSSILDVVILPVLMSFIWSLFLTSTQFYTALFCVLIVQLKNFILSVINIKNYTSINKPKITLLTLYYVFILGSIAMLSITVKQWTEPFIITKNYASLLFEVGNFIFIKFFITSFLIALLTAFISNLILDKKIRRMNIDNMHRERNFILQETAFSSESDE